MADAITARATGNSFLPHPEGTHGMVCVDVVDLGERVEQFANKPRRIVPKCALVFGSEERNPETGDLHTVHAEFTVSMSDRANLRHLLEQWRGKSYTPEQLAEGVPLHKLLGQPTLITVEHKISSGGRTYAVIRSISPLPKGMPKAVLPEYKRPDFWTEKKSGYAAEVAKAREQSAPASEDDFPPPLDDDDDLPF